MIDESDYKDWEDSGLWSPLDFIKGDGWEQRTVAAEVGNGCIVQIIHKQKKPDNSWEVNISSTFVPKTSINFWSSEDGQVARDIVEKSEELSQGAYNPEVGDFKVTIIYFDPFTETDQKKTYPNVDRDRITSLLKKYAGTLREATIRKLPLAPPETSA